jgi:uncharacterized protein YecT (DUF1311 family)
MNQFKRGRIYFQLLLLLGVYGLSSLEARDRYDETFDSIYVAQKIYYSLDADLNRVYRALRGHLSKEGRRVLARSERGWVSHRDHRCAYPQTHSVNIDCAVSQTRQRFYFLQERLRECEEIGCRIEKLY